MAAKKYLTDEDVLTFLTQATAVVEKAIEYRKIVEPQEKNLADISNLVSQKHQELAELNRAIEKAKAAKTAFLPPSPLSDAEWRQILSILRGKDTFCYRAVLKLAALWGAKLRG